MVCLLFRVNTSVSRPFSSCVIYSVIVLLNNLEMIPVVNGLNSRTHSFNLFHSPFLFYFNILLSLVVRMQSSDDRMVNTVTGYIEPITHALIGGCTGVLVDVLCSFPVNCNITIHSFSQSFSISHSVNF